MNAAPKMALNAQIAILHTAIHGLVGEGLYQGLARVALDIQRDAQKGAPIDTGNLRGSAFTVGSKRPGTARVHRTPKPKRPAPEPQALENAVKEGKAFTSSRQGPIVVTGFGATYAEVVHEGDPARSWHKGAPQFMTKAVEMNIPRAKLVIEAELAKHIVATK